MPGARSSAPRSPPPSPLMDSKLTENAPRRVGDRLPGCTASNDVSDDVVDHQQESHRLTRQEAGAGYPQGFVHRHDAAAHHDHRLSGFADQEHPRLARGNACRERADRAGLPDQPGPAHPGSLYKLPAQGWSRGRVSGPGQQSWLYNALSLDPLPDYATAYAIPGMPYSPDRRGAAAHAQKAPRGCAARAFVRAIQLSEA